jgi:hypothetical protein
MTTNLELAVGAGAALFLAVYPLALVIADELDRRDLERRAWDRSARRHGAHPGDRRLEQLGRVVELDDVFEYLGPPTVIPGDPLRPRLLELDDGYAEAIAVGTVAGAPLEVRAVLPTEAARRLRVDVRHTAGGLALVDGDRVVAFTTTDT